MAGMANFMNANNVPNYITYSQSRTKRRLRR